MTAAVLVFLVAFLLSGWFVGDWVLERRHARRLARYDAALLAVADEGRGP